MNNRWAVVSATTNCVDSIIVWDGETSWNAPDGFFSVNLGDQYAEIGYIYDNETGTFSEPLEE